MSEYRYKVEDLENYTGILISQFSNGKFKMELKVEDNPVLERSVEKIESSIELEFKHNMGTSTLFYHNILSCPLRTRQKEECHECDKYIEKYEIFETNLYQLQVGDTFRIQAALINNRQSELPVRIQSFKDYEPLTVACIENELRRTDSTEGIKKKYELEQQRLQREREEEEKRKEEEEKRKIEAGKAKRREKWVRLEQWLAKYSNILKIGGAIIGTTVLNQIPNIIKGVKYLLKLWSPE